MRRGITKREQRTKEEERIHVGTRERWQGMRESVKTVKVSGTLEARRCKYTFSYKPLTINETLKKTQKKET